MMKNSHLILMIFVFFFVSCQKNDFGLSDCLNGKIKEFKNGDYACNQGANVKEYLFMDELVYVFNPGLCGADMTSEVIDKNCNSLGFLGGIAGNVIINDTDFNEAVFIKTIWER